MDTHFSPIKTLSWLFFDLNSYFASVEQQDRPDLRSKPIAVVPSMTDSTCAIAASYEAKAYGIKTGTKIYEAKKMCPDLICVQARHDIYVRYHKRILQEVERHVPVTKICSIDEAACKLSPLDQSPTRAVALAHAIKEGLRDNVGEYIKCSIGIASNPFLAKIATDMKKPYGLVVLHPHDFEEKLFTMKLRDLCGIGAKIELRLNKAGVHSVRQLWDLPPKHARKIWGSVAGERFWYRLHGYDVPDTLSSTHMVGHSRVLDPDLRAPEKAYEILRQLTIKAATRLRKQEFFARKLAMSIRTIHGKRIQGERSFAPTQDNFSLLKVLETLWHAAITATGGMNIMKVSMSLYDLYKKEEMTLDLFEAANQRDQKANAPPPRVCKASALTKAIDELNQKYGGSAVQIGQAPTTKSGYVGTKIAFTRVPDLEEFEHM